MKKREEIVTEIIALFESNEEFFNHCIEDLDGFNGYLGDDRFYQMEELNELYQGSKPIELLNRAFFGHDGGTWHLDSYGCKVFEAPFNPNRNYFSFNGYGNLVSYDSVDYSDRLDSYFVEALNENKQYLYCVDSNEELKKLLDELDEIEE